MEETKRLKSAVVLPTYNEAGNIQSIVKEVLRQNDKIIVVVVDDNSPDGTGKIVEEMTTRYPERIKILHRKKRGRASAGLDGFKYCLSLGIDYIFEMDADFSHDPNEIPNFLKEIEHYDIVIGSRYVDGGGAINCPRCGRWISIFANAFNRFIFGYKIRDNSGGFKCYRREVLESIDLDRFVSKGYSVGAEMLFYCYLKNLTMKEIPIIFKNRELGSSKQSIKVITSYPLDVLRVKYFPKIRYRRIYSKYDQMNPTYYDEHLDKEKVGAFRSWYHLSRYHFLQQVILQHSDDNPVILDLGCGSCNWNERGISVVGIDINKNLLKQAMEMDRISGSICCDVKRLCLKGESADIIVASEMLEHIDRLNSFMQGCRKALKPKGKMIITVPYDFIASPFYILFRTHCFIQGYLKGKDYYKKQCGHINHFTKRSLKRLLIENGFKVTSLSIFNYFLIVAVAEKE